MPNDNESNGDIMQVKIDRALMDRLASLSYPPYVGNSHGDRAEYAISRFLESGSEAGDMGVKPELSRVANKRGRATTKTA